MLEEGKEEKVKGEAMTLPWSERVNMLSVNPCAASLEDIAKLAALHEITFRLASAIREYRLGVYSAGLRITASLKDYDEWRGVKV